MMSMLKMASETRTRMTTRNGQVIRMSCAFSPLDGMSIGMSLLQTQCWGELPGSGGGHRMVSHLYFWRLLGCRAQPLVARLHPTKLRVWLKFITQCAIQRKHQKINWGPAVVFESGATCFGPRRSAIFGQNLGSCRRNQPLLLPVRQRLDRRGQSRHLSEVARPLHPRSRTC